MRANHIPRAIQDRIRQIRNDHRSGSTALARRAAEALVELTRLPLCRTDFERQLVKTCCALVAAQPQMAAILNLCNAALWASEDSPDADAAPSFVRAAVDEFLSAAQNAAKGIAQTTAALISDCTAVATHSYSSAVRDALREAASGCCKFRVAITESRPLLEGLALAKELASSGIPVTLGVDAAIALLLKDADLVLVGADAVTEAFLVNKAGTFPAALLARQQAIPFYALAGAEKFAPRTRRLPDESSKEPSEVLRRPPRRVEIRNLYFDQTPLNLITGIVTAQGVLSPRQVRLRLRKLRLHPALTGGQLSNRQR
ncbi:MAG: translation initiation factor eIF-2B [Bryobacteraceae bacterium]